MNDIFDVPDQDNRDWERLQSEAEYSRNPDDDWEEPPDYGATVRQGGDDEEEDVVDREEYEPGFAMYSLDWLNRLYADHFGWRPGTRKAEGDI